MYDKPLDELEVSTLKQQKTCASDKCQKLETKENNFSFRNPDRQIRGQRIGKIYRSFRSSIPCHLPAVRQGADHLRRRPQERGLHPGLISSNSFL